MLEAFEALCEQTLAAPEWLDEAERATIEGAAAAFVEHSDWERAQVGTGLPNGVLYQPRVQRLIRDAAQRGSVAVRDEMARRRAERDKGDGDVPSQLDVLSAGNWAGQTPPEMPWIVPHWIPSRAVTLLAGDGGTGKSLMVQQLLSCLSLGQPFMGAHGAQPMRCLYLNCEDDSGELHRRQVAIAKAMGREMQAFGDDMLIVPRLGAPDNALGTFDAVTGQFKPTPLYEAIRAYCIAHGVRVLALDNVAHLYSGNENIRGEVTAFLNALSRLALEIDGAVILIGHPAKADGSQYSGSTAWENGVRNRLYLCRPNDDDGRSIENRRILTRSKSNVASIGDEIVMVWHEGAFQPPGVVEVAVGRDTEVEAIFEACLKAANAQRRNVSHATGSNYAPKLFAAMSESRGVGRKALAAAMERLFSKGRIVANQPLWFNEGSRRQVHGIAFAAT